MTETISQAITAVFVDHPDANIAVIDMGHAYRTAKFASRCPVTDTWILEGSRIRRVTLVTRSGQIIDGTMSNDTFGMIFNKTAPDTTTFFSTFQRCHEGWLAAVAAAPEGSTLQIITEHCEMRLYRRTEGGWVKVGGTANMSLKQITRATKAARAFLITP